MSAPVTFRCSSCRRILANIDDIPADRVVTVPTCPYHSARLTPKQIKAAARDGRPIPVSYSSIRLTVPRTAGGVVTVDPVGPGHYGDSVKRKDYWIAWADYIGRGVDPGVWVAPIRPEPGMKYPEWVNVRRPAKRVMSYADWVEAGQPIEPGMTVEYDD